MRAVRWECWQCDTKIFPELKFLPGYYVEPCCSEMLRLCGNEKLYTYHLFCFCIRAFNFSRAFCIICVGKWHTC